VRIAIIAHLKYAIGEPFAGGLEMHTHILARSLRERGHDVTLFASTRSDPSLGLEAICEETSLLETGIDEANDVAFFREHNAYLDLMTALRSRSFDLIHNNSLHYLPVSMSETLSVPVVTTLHTPPFCWLESGIRLNRGPMTYVAVSEATAAMWRHVAHAHHVIPNGIDPRHFPYQPIANQKPYLIWYGRIVPEKGLDYAIDASRLAGLPLRIAGPISNQGYFDKLIAPRLGGDVEYVGHLSHIALSKLVGGAVAALCTPRWEEPYGLVVAEALACGTPVAAFARGGLPALLTPDCGVLAEPDNISSLASAVLAASLLERSACRAYAEHYCCSRRMVDEYEALYRHLAMAPIAIPNAPDIGLPPVADVA
jgi:glycosyltransferase involved in cell wall biosynthesis